MISSKIYILRKKTVSAGTAKYQSTQGRYFLVHKRKSLIYFLKKAFDVYLRLLPGACLE